jgi:hypothetical protein
MSAMLWPVFSFANPSQPVVAHFFNQSDAVDFVNANLGERNLYIGPAKYDRRTSGYRASDPYANAYREWLASLDIPPARYVMTERARLGKAA